jgi:hypothetical protein
MGCGPASEGDQDGTAMFDLFAPPHSILPRWLLDVNLLKVFLWYITLLFFVSMGLRLRFYHSVYVIAQHVRFSCPRVFSLINEHWFICLRDGLLTWFSIYLTLLGPYVLLNQFVWPKANVSLADLQDVHHGLVTLLLALIGVMLAIDGILLAQVSVIDTERVRNDLTWSDGWLGGKLNFLLAHMGKWNPIKWYADKVTHENMRWLNKVFRNSIWSMIVQLAIRMAVAVFLYVSVFLKA